MTDTQLALVGSQSNWGMEINVWCQHLKPALGGDPEWGPPSAAPAPLMVCVRSEPSVLHLLTLFFFMISYRKEPLKIWQWLLYRSPESTSQLPMEG